MGVASLVLGILSIILVWFPCVTWISWILAPLGLIFGIVGCVTASKKKAPKGSAIAGIILNAITLCLSVLVIGAFAAAVSSGL